MQDLFIPTSIVFAATLVVGYILSHLLYKKRGKKFRGSDLEIKVLMWLPIYLVFVLFVIGNQLFQILISIVILYHIVKEVRSQLHKGYPFMVTYYALLVGLGMVAIWLMSSVSIGATVGLVFASVYSDVFAFFAGNYFGKHPLPEFINANKSWEGVAGQIVGALVGLVLISLFVTPLSIWIALPVGLGSAFGDMLNSYVKRLLKIKDWGNHIKGHGGYLDRFASLSFAAIALYIVEFL